MEESVDWQSSLKVGDQICYQSQWRGYVIETILKITPTGMIKTTGGLTFKNGLHRSDDWTRYHMEEVTPKVLAQLEHVELYEKLKNVDLKKLSMDQMKAILEIVGG